MTLIQIVDILKKIALQQPNVRTATDGDIFDVLNSNPNVRYGVFHVNQTNHKEEDDIDTYGLNLFYVDRLTDDDENRLLIQSVGKSIIGNIVTTFCEEFDGEAPTITYTPFTQRFTDECAGVWCSVNISVTKEYACAEQYGEWLKPTVVVINNEDITIVKNGVYLPSAGFTGFGKVVVDLPVENVQEVAYLTVNAGDNGVLKPDNGYTAIREVEYSSKPLTNTSITIVENGNYTIENTDTEYQGLSKVDVDVNLPIEPVKQIDITKVGNYEVRPDEGIAIEGVDINVTLDNKIDPTEYGITFGYSTFTALPDVFELPQRIEPSKLNSLFRYCENLTDISCFENVTDIYYVGRLFSTISVFHQTFNYCKSLADLTPLNNIRLTVTDEDLTDIYNTVKFNFNYAFQYTVVTDFSPLAHIFDYVTYDYTFDVGSYAFASSALKRFELDWDWSKCTSYYQMLGANTDIEYIQELDATSVTNGYNPLDVLSITGSGYTAKLTYFGGFKNQKLSMTSNYFLTKCPNLTRESCLAIVNNLYDFVGNSETPTSSQGKLKVNANFISTLGDDINIAINKGWTVTT